MRWCWGRGIICVSAGFKKALVGLSGGIDSALVAAIAVEALGAENVAGIGMPSEFSSTGSVTDAEKLAQNLGIAFTTVAIADVYAQFSGALEPFFKGQSLGWRRRICSRGFAAAC